MTEADGQLARCEGRFIPRWAQHRVAKALGRTVWSDDDHKIAPTSDIKGPQCRPWHRGDLLQRLSTFKTTKWFAKPAPLSAIQCARHGWSNIAVDTLECEVCKQRIVIATPLEIVPAGIDNPTVAQLASSLPLAHSSRCGWRDNPCHASVADPVVASPANTVKDLAQRYNSIITSKVEVTLVEDAEIAAICEKLKQSSAFSRFPDLTAFVLALFGWSADERKDRLCCRECTRVVGVWNFEQKKAPSIGSKRPHQEGGGSHQDLAAFDPVKEHYSYCSWIQKTNDSTRSLAKEDEFSSGGSWRMCASALFRPDASTQSVVSPVRNTSAPLEPIELASNVAKFFATSCLSIAEDDGSTQ